MYSILTLAIFVTSAIALRLDSIQSSKYKPAKFSTPSSNTVTQNTFSLQRKSGVRSLSSNFVRALRPQIGEQPITSASLGSVYLTEIAFGTETFQVVIDTGSSDTWLAETGFTCVDPSTNQTIAPEDCFFGSTYTRSPTFEQIPDQNFAIGYADGEILVGVPGNETVTLAGIVLPDQEVGVVSLAGWFGDGISSGLLGLAYPSLTSAYAGTDYTKDTDANARPYDPVFTTAYTRGYIDPIFSLAISRDESQTGDGGVIALGGVPAGTTNSTGPFTSTPIELLELSTSTQYLFYTISVDGLAYPNASPDGPVQYIVDSGTTLNYIPTSDADTVNALFDPPATLQDGLYLVACDAVAPEFSVVIGGTEFPTNPLDLVLDVGAGNTCVSGIQDGGTIDEDLFILGDVFLKNVLAVFDVGAAELRFAEREFYDS